MSEAKRPCVFLDRDGIANVPPPPDEYYVLSPERFFIIPEFLETLKVVQRKGYVAIIVTNQRSVERGLLTLEGLEKIHDQLRAKANAAGVSLLDIYVCPHGNGHPDQKPRPGMLLRAAEEHSLDLPRSWMIGDQDRDIEAGRAAGCSTSILVRDSREETDADAHLLSMSELPGYLEEHLPEV